VYTALYRHLYTRNPAPSGLALVQAPSFQQSSCFCSRSMLWLQHMGSTTKWQMRSTTKMLHRHASLVYVWDPNRMPSLPTVWMKTSYQHATQAQRNAVQLKRNGFNRGATLQNFWPNVSMISLRQNLSLRQVCHLDVIR